MRATICLNKTHDVSSVQRVRSNSEEKERVARYNERTRSFISFRRISLVSGKSTASVNVSKLNCEREAIPFSATEIKLCKLKKGKPKYTRLSNANERELMNIKIAINNIL